MSSWQNIVATSCIKKKTSQKKQAPFYRFFWEAIVEQDDGMKKMQSLRVVNIITIKQSHCFCSFSCGTCQQEEKGSLHWGIDAAEKAYI